MTTTAWSEKSPALSISATRESAIRLARFWFGWLPALLPFALQAQFSYATNNGSITITSYTASSSTVTIPASINGIPVTTIGESAFAQNHLTAVNIPGSVTNIANNAFQYCDQLKDVTIPEGVITIGDNAFHSCIRLKRVTVPNSVVTIGSYAFYSCNSLTSVTIPNRVASINAYAFCNCTSLTAVSIPNGVTTIGDGAFCNCVSLEAVNIPNSVTVIGATAFRSCSSLTRLTIGNSMVSIGSDGFYGCIGLSSVTIPSTVTTIGPAAFGACSNLKRMYFLGDLHSPGMDADIFQENGVTTVFHLPTANGWGSSFNGRPTALFDSAAPISDTNFGLGSGRFGFTMIGSNTLTVVVEACEDLAHPLWIPVGTNTLAAGVSHFEDTSWSNHTARVYRLRSP